MLPNTLCSCYSESLALQRFNNSYTSSHGTPVLLVLLSSRPCWHPSSESLLHFLLFSSSQIVVVWNPLVVLGIPCYFIFPTYKSIVFTPCLFLQTLPLKTVPLPSILNFVVWGNPKAIDSHPSHTSTRSQSPQPIQSSSNPATSSSNFCSCKPFPHPFSTSSFG
jgi:hypothetical protein